MTRTKNELNRNGDERGMSPESRKNLELGRKTNHRAQKDISITRIQEEMLDQLCPYAEDPTWTWARTIAVAGLREALTDEKARENLKDRVEGKVALPIQPVGKNGAIPTFLLVMSDGSKRTAKELADKVTSPAV